ncbi:MAG TPA: hypothetical protein VK464_16720 [Symbiobacteriaceae bacterium]|jgi:hypothetical protein|nr:hypothetical protein [Symbiobacteriaceae bacterium]
MAATGEFPAVFQRLKAILAPHAPRLLVKTDTADVYYLDTAHVMPNKLPLFFGAAQVKKNYVSFYLFPVYMYPEMLEGLSPGLRKRMQGKSCFNFTQVDEPLLEELASLTNAGMARFEAVGYVGR